MIDEARSEARRMLDALQPFVADGIPVVGLEPSCLLGMRDEFKTLLPGRESDALAYLALTFEEFLMRENNERQLQLDLQPTRFRRALVHGHCHEKAFDVMPSVTGLLGLVPDLEVEVIASGCCGMAGAFGYDANTIDISQQMAEVSLLPAVRAADNDTVIIADGTSCRHQVLDGADHEICHAVKLLAESLI